MRLEGKVAVITGAGSGMGRAMANLFSAEGAKIVAAEWNAATLAEVVEEVKAAGGEIVGVEGNVALVEDCERIIDTAVEAFGTVDVLCNNAGVMDGFAGAANATDEMYERVFGVNVSGPFYLTRKALAVMLKKGSGSIINTASVAGVGGGAAGVIYTMSKHAVIGLTKNTAWQYALKGVRCNAIVAGGVETNIMSSVDQSKMDPEGAERAQKYASIIPGMLKATDIADLALFLASDESKMINGAAIPADAGWLAAG
ncbi:MAG: SDR family oxidoreductase [Coriobacteriia bacterium]